MQPKVGYTCGPTRGARCTTTTSSTLFCGTCCDVDVDNDVSIAEEALLAEIEFDVLAPGEPQCDVSCSLAPGFENPSRIVQVDGNRVHVCIASGDGIAGPGLLVTCHGSAGGSLVDVVDVSARDFGLLRNSRPPEIAVTE